MIRKIKLSSIFAVMAVLASCTATGQKSINDFLSLDTVLNLPQRMYNIRDISTCMNGDDVYFINYSTRMHRDSLYLYRLNTHTVLLDSYLISLPGMTELLKKHQCQNWGSIACNGKHLLLATASLRYVFENQQGIYTYKNHWDKKTNGRNCSFFNDSTIIIWDMVHGQEPETCIGLHDLKSGKTINHITPYFLHPLLCYHKPDHLVDINNGNVLFAHKGKYSIVIYNNNLDSVAHIQRDIADWVSLSEKQISHIRKHYNIYDAGNIIAAEDKWMHTIHRLFEVFWIDSNKFIAVYQTPYSKHEFPTAFVDVWEKRNGSFVLKHTDIEDNYSIHVGKDSIIGPHSFGLATLSNNKFIFTEDRVIVFRNFGTNINPLGMNINKYGKMYKEDYIEHGNSLEIFIFMHSF